MHVHGETYTCIIINMCILHVYIITHAALSPDEGTQCHGDTTITVLAVFVAVKMVGICIS